MTAATMPTMPSTAVPAHAATTRAMTHAGRTAHTTATRAVHAAAGAGIRAARAIHAATGAGIRAARAVHAATGAGIRAARAIHAATGASVRAARAIHAATGASVRLPGMRTVVRALSGSVGMPAGVKWTVLRLPCMVKMACGFSGMSGCTMMERMTRTMMSAGGAATGVMTMRVVARAVRAVNMARIAPVTAVPRRRPPGRHDTGRRQCTKGEHRRPVGIIPIHGTSVIITVNRETRRIIAGIRPGSHMTMGIHCNTTAAAHGYLSVRSHRHKAGGKHHRRCRQHSQINGFFFHNTDTKRGSYTAGSLPVTLTQAYSA